MDPELEQQTATPPQDGAPEQAAEQPAERQLTPRELAMAAIQVRRDDDEQPVDETAQPAAVPAAQPEPDQLATQLDQPMVLADDLSKYRVKVKINGVEQEVSVADMQRQFQINGAAERRLQQANALYAQAKAQTTPPVGIAPDAASPDSPPAPKPQGEGKRKAERVLKAILDGDDDTAITELAEAFEGRQHQPTPIDQAQLVAQVTPEVRQQIANDMVLDAFMAANPDIVADPYLVDLTERFINAEMATGKAYPDALNAAGQQTRDWVAKLGGGKPTAEPQPTVRDKKLERKADMDNLPALNRTASSTQEAPETASSVIQDMRKARGLE